MSFKLGNTNIGELYVGSSKIAQAFLGSNLVYQASVPDPYNPLGLPPNTVRIRTSNGLWPNGYYGKYESAKKVEGTSDIYDVYKSGTDFDQFLYGSTNIAEVLGANTSGITNMRSMFFNCTALSSVTLFDTSNVTKTEGMFKQCTSLTSIPLFDTSKITEMNHMFASCPNVVSGALALYQQASTQTNPPPTLGHQHTFTNCGSNTQTGSAELAQIPSDWK